MRLQTKALPCRTTSNPSSRLCNAAPSLPEDTRRFAPHDGVPTQAAAPSVGQQVKLSAEDEQALTTLAEFGPFSREQRIEAYLACGKNIEQAGTYLFDQMS